MNILCKQCNKEFRARKERKYCSRKCFDLRRQTALTESNNPNWKGKRATYGQKHRWIRNTYGNAVKCEECGTTEWVEWSNIDHKYSRDINDYKQLCKKCHGTYDRIQFGWAVERGLT